MKLNFFVDGVQNHWWECRLLQGRLPPHPPNFQVLSATKVERSDPSGAGASDQADSQGRSAKHWLGASREAFRRAASEYSLSLTVAVSPNDKWIQRGDGGGEEHERLGKGCRGGPRHFSREDTSRGSVGSGFEGGGVGVGVLESVPSRRHSGDRRKEWYGMGIAMCQ